MVGVGGQGIILASKILSAGLQQQGYDLKMSEIHGMAQRGGSVITQIRFGEKVFSPIIGRGEADLLIAFEKIEAVRYLPYLRPEGILVVNDHELYPLPVLSGREEYPRDVVPSLQQRVPHCRVLPAQKLAEELGNPKVQNMILLGAALGAFGLADFAWPEVLRVYVPTHLRELNQKALQVGLDS